MLSYMYYKRGPVDLKHIVNIYNGTHVTYIFDNYEEASSTSTSYDDPSNTLMTTRRHSANRP